MKLFDSHTHLYAEEFNPDNAVAVNRAIEAGVGMMMFPNIDINSIAPMRRLHQQFPQSTIMAMGLHPTEVRETWIDDLSVIENEWNLNRADYRAIGEIGMDLYWDKTFEREQKSVLDIQLGWADKADIPAIIHCRDGLAEVLDVVDSRRGRMPQLIFHSFGGDGDDVAKIRRRTDAYFGINGIVTFKNSQLRTVLNAIGLNHMLLETDSPYLAPVPYRGKRNESSYLPAIAEFIAKSMAISPAEIANVTWKSSMMIFGVQ